MKPLSPRKYPTQDRSRHTVDAVIQAAGQVLVAEGLQKTTTHVIARRAGVSVGTLYQYFPNKESVFIELQRRFSNSLYENIEEMLHTLRALPLKDAISLFVKGLMSHIQKSPETWMALLEHRNQFLPKDEKALRNHKLRTLLAQLFFEKRDECHIQNFEFTSFVLVNVCESLTHNVLLECPQNLKNGVLESELITLLSRYLLGAS